ncbi:MAG: SusC/RagA family TonB-linked outer membrane protein [Bacteroides sp.]|nr:SusC/RagA family TonB-linked outer membrane protein [Bacteroides sp.]MBD5319525.1 SusC/RagA family TonB-linked outer membrane protein [Bacteroides sp.]
MKAKLTCLLVCMMMLPMLAFAANKVVGTVTDSNGDPLIGVSVLVKGTQFGTQTNIDGEYSINASQGNVLTFTYVGFLPQEVTVGSNSTINVTLQEDNRVLDEVVVTALGIKRSEKALTYNTQQVKADEITGVKDANFVNALSGKVAGMNINASSAGIGGGSKVVLRGSKSLSGNNNALYVIDGIPMPSLQSKQSEDLFTGMGQSGDGAAMLNPEDIESISVLSGAAASALYGSEAANGVVMITTRKGEEGRTKVTYSNSTIFLNAMATPEFQNTYGANNGEFRSWGAKLGQPSSYDPTDFFQTGFNETNAVTLTAGNATNQTFLSLAATNAEGIVMNNTLDRYNFTIRNTTALIKDKLRLDVSASYMNLKENNMVAQGQYMNPVVPIYLMSPSYSLETYKVFEMYNQERNFKTQYWPWGNQGLGMQNPYWITQRDNFTNHKTRYFMTAGLYWDNVVKGLNISARAKLDQTNALYETKYSASTDAIFADQYGAYFKNDASTRQLYGDVMATYNNDFGQVQLNAALGASINDVQSKWFYQGGDLASVANHFELANVNPTGTHTKLYGDHYHDQTQSIFATAQVGFRNYLFLDLAGRIDWASALAYTNANSVAYPSVGLSAILTDMIPALHTPALTFLKIRGSYSEVGNAPQRYIGYSTYAYEKTMPATSTNYPNHDIKPERTKAWEVGLSARFWGDKLKLDVSLYKTSTFNQLFNPTLPASSGYKSVYINGGQIDNKGIELSLGLIQPLGPVQWESNFTYTLNRNKVVKLLKPTTLDNGMEVSQSVYDIATLGNVKSRLVEGGSIGDLYVTTLKRDHHGHIIVDYVEQTVERDNNAGPNKDGWIYAGNAEAKYTMGWRNSFSWKGLHLGFLINARVGGQAVSMTQAYMDAYGVSTESAAARDAGGVYVNGYFLAGAAQKYYEYVGSNAGENYVYSATNVRLGELTLGYDIPVNRWVNWIKGLNVSFIGRNLFFIYKKAPFDPELTASTNIGWSGMDYFMLPSMRNLGFSVKVNF